MIVDDIRGENKIQLIHDLLLRLFLDNLNTGIFETIAP
jgi:hypothetical protein